MGDIEEWARKWLEDQRQKGKKGDSYSIDKQKEVMKSGTVLSQKEELQFQIILG
jgi:hypothetical protein